MDAARKLTEKDHSHEKSDSGVSMDFSADLLDDVATVTEEMMRLSALGYFKQARQLCDGPVAQYTDIFPVALERMRLLHSQGDYDGLLSAADALQESHYLSAIQEQVLKIWQDLAVLESQKTSSREAQSRNTESLQEVIEQLDSIRFAQVEERDELETEQIILYVLRLRWWSLVAIQANDDSPFLPMTSNEHRDLTRIGAALNTACDYWAAERIFDILFLPIESPQPEEGLSYWLDEFLPALPSYVVISEQDLNTPSGKVAQMSLLNTLQETLAAVRHYDWPTQSFTPQIEMAIKEISGIRMKILDESSGTGFGPRNDLFFRLMSLEERAFTSFKSDGLTLKDWDLAELTRLLQVTQTHDDYRAEQEVASRMRHGADGTLVSHILSAYSNRGDTQYRPLVELRLRSTPEIGRMLMSMSTAPESQVQDRRHSLRPNASLNSHSQHEAVGRGSIDAIAPPNLDRTSRGPVNGERSPRVARSMPPPLVRGTSSASDMSTRSTLRTYDDVRLRLKRVETYVKTILDDPNENEDFQEEISMLTDRVDDSNKRLTDIIHDCELSRPGKGKNSISSLMRWNLYGKRKFKSLLADYTRDADTLERYVSMIVVEKRRQRRDEREARQDVFQREQQERQEQYHLEIQNRFMSLETSLSQRTTPLPSADREDQEAFFDAQPQLPPFSFEAEDAENMKAGVRSKRQVYA